MRLLVGDRPVSGLSIFSVQTSTSFTEVTSCCNLHFYTDTLIHLCTDTLIVIHWYTYTLIRLYTDTLIHLYGILFYTDTLIYWYTYTRAANPGGMGEYIPPPPRYLTSIPPNNWILTKIGEKKPGEQKKGHQKKKFKKIIPPISKNHQNMLIIPPNTGHGFAALTYTLIDWYTYALISLYTYTLIHWYTDILIYKGRTKSSAQWLLISLLCTSHVICHTNYKYLTLC